ncbi:MAG: ParB/RepB/Spo0J family partition protein [Candidatus Kaiserbacteria bacterium]|nr:ParB/RepB/Spo0J family partition protein [Candidatus Kaiserbacteria bacterium]
MNDDARYVPTKYDSVFWIDVEKIVPNPYQPRKEFSELGLKSLAESIRQYGVLQPLVVSRTDVEKPDGGLESVYELVAGERRLRASKLAGLKQVPVVIRQGDTNLTKLELAIIENLQREDLNAIDRAKALQKLIEEFGLSHIETGAKIGKSREYVSNSLRLLVLPEYMQDAIVAREITEGHARPLLALTSRPQEQETLFKEIILKRLPVRAAERIARSIAQENVRARHKKSVEMVELEKSLTETLGTRVIIETNAEGGRLLIEFFSPDDLQQLVDTLATEHKIEQVEEAPLPIFANTTQLSSDPIAAAAPEEPGEDDELYAVSSFSV